MTFPPSWRVLDTMDDPVEQVRCLHGTGGGCGGCHTRGGELMTQAAMMSHGVPFSRGSTWPSSGLLPGALGTSDRPLSMEMIRKSPRSSWKHARLKSTAAARMAACPGWKPEFPFSGTSHSPHVIFLVLLQRDGGERDLEAGRPSPYAYFFSRFNHT